MPKSAFITISDCIKSFLGDTYASNTEAYQRCMAWMLRFNNEMEYDVFKNFKRTYIGIDTSTMTAKLPDDYVQYTQIGLRTENNEFVPLVYNPSIILNVETPTCDAISDHCDECDCDDEVCYAFGESNAVTTFTDVVINGTTYQDSVTICTQDSGDVIKRTCTHVVTNAVQKCNYSITFNFQTINFPLTDVYFVRNGVHVTVGDVEDSTAMIAILVAFGWTNANPTFTITQTTNVWTSITYTNEIGEITTLPITQSGCATPTPTVEEYCYEEKVCEVEVLPCGCIIPSDTSINVLCACSDTFALAVTSRARNNKNFGHSLIPSPGYFGEFSIDVNAGYIKFNLDYAYDTVFLEYYSAGQVDSKEYLIPVQAEECAVAFLYWKSLQRKTNADKWEKQMAMKSYYNEKRLLKARLNPLNLDNFLSTLRTLPVRP